MKTAELRHTLNNYLQIIMGSCELMSIDADDKIKKDIERIETSAQTMRELIRMNLVQ